MRTAVLISWFSALLLGAMAARAQTPPTEVPESSVVEEEPAIVPIPASTMSELMVKVIYPASDAILYISSRTPTNETEWNELQGKALILAESANLMLMPERALDSGQWMKDTKLMLDAGLAAYEASLAEDVDALMELNDPLYQSCIVCHQHYRPDYLKDARLKLQNPPSD